tara:strand:+ start:888 stop:1130 length:243 start_codon:yes stop_codon:yes gene_type:complete
MIFELGWAALAAILHSLSQWLCGAEMVMDQLIFSSIFNYLNVENFNRFLIIGSFILLIFITIAVIYISFVSWKDKKRIDK